MITKIAIRNIIANRRRSFLIGFVIFVAAFLLLIANAFVNGVGFQVNKAYSQLQAGDVIVGWESLEKMEKTDATRLLFMGANSFDVKKETENRQTMDVLKGFLDQNQQKIESYYPTVRRNAGLEVGNMSDAQFSVFGLTPELRDRLQQSKTVSMQEGQLLSDLPRSIAVSQEKALSYSLKLGDKVNLNVITPAGEVRAEQFTVRGIYNNGAGWDNWYGFTSDQDARKLFQYENGYFDIVKIYLNDAGESKKFAKQLNAALGDGVLYAETGQSASLLYPTMSMALKGLFNLFIMFLIIVIAIGMRSAIRMNLYQRMQEFGTLRAIGYSRTQCFGIIFNEAFFLSIGALIAAFVPALLFNMIFSTNGIYLGPGPMSYFGGEYLYPDMQIADVALALGVLAVFSLIATMNPGLSLVYQTITDIMNKRQRPVKVMRTLYRNVFRRG
ncbi:ABC transporter permease [Paenibacillus harenae]|uniref:ABC transporter permease n=1 Tax=Paenibacillus harenae TaxID=306543 RepID=UPI00278DB75F|nr:FtsX-like permease family protein [Paenibacillus harenae]MDQ0059014.1 ABC-type lipoprotein release transport system permease subunit [Paenibacillus harenae]